MTNDATRTTAEILPDEIVVIGKRLGAAICVGNELFMKAGAARRDEDHSAENRFDDASSHAFDEYYALCEMLSLAKAGTLTGAAIQLAHALNLVDAVWDQFPKSEKTYQIMKDVRAIKRLLFSVLDLVDGLADRRLAETVPEFGSPYLNPWGLRTKRFRPSSANFHSRSPRERGLLFEIERALRSVARDHPISNYGKIPNSLAFCSIADIFRNRKVAPWLAYPP